jgi:hypothetical protein
MQARHRARKRGGGKGGGGKGGPGKGGGGKGGGGYGYGHDDDADQDGGQHHEAPAGAAVTGTSRSRPKRGMQFAFSESPAEMAVNFNGSHLQMKVGSAHLPLLRQLCAGETGVAALAGEDTFTKICLVRMLVGKGILEMVE